MLLTSINETSSHVKIISNTALCGHVLFFDMLALSSFFLIQYPSRQDVSAVTDCKKMFSKTNQFQANADLKKTKKKTNKPLALTVLSIAVPSRISIQIIIFFKRL